MQERQAPAGNSLGDTSIVKSQWIAWVRDGQGSVLGAQPIYSGDWIGDAHIQAEETSAEEALRRPDRRDVCPLSKQQALSEGNVLLFCVVE